ncbi:GIY-YIG nuclease family protein [Neobacillus piezotolerans]|uniref:GIY-YIG nuclease family protein n=1 Tax=Neobacillus piezotolerans TaxID=2259171 RepID=A0A3D8GK32_9BACI|nr:GIY-YIG nuclease family protein [Neobacillus piezotolerans]RDU34815.1 GIY-YIG nuclease family protein [Neobacillus piezotolerans]
MEETEHYFYVLQCRDGSYYGGYTTDLERRVRLHNEGKGAKYTRGRGPVELVFARAFQTKTEAMRAEYRFKQLSRAKKEEYLATEGECADAAAEEL